MTIEKFITSTFVFKKLMNDVKNKKLSHAYIFFCSDDIIRDGFIKAFSKLIFCHDYGCNQCKTCLSIDTEILPDLKYYNKESKMKVEHASALTEAIIMASVNNGMKIVVLENANELSVDVQNKLLKTYEEPPDDSVIILSAKSESGILKTILSRAVKINLPVLSDENLYQILIAENELTQSEAQKTAILSMGSLDRANKIKGNATAFLFDEVEKIFFLCKRTKDIVLFLNSPAFSTENIELCFDIMESFLHFILQYLVKVAIPLPFLDSPQRFMETAGEFSKESVAMSLLKIAEARMKLKSNIKSLSVAESLLMDIMEVKYTWR